METEAIEKRHISEDEEEDNLSSGNVTYLVNNSKERQGLPRWDSRWPIDVWVSCGEPFVPLEGMSGFKCCSWFERI